MATILIPTIPDDMHAAAVTCVLERTGHRVLRWRCADFPEHGSISIATGSTDSRIDIADAAGGLIDAQPDVYWNRRIARPVIATAMDPADRRFALREAATLLAGALDLTSRLAFAVNPPAAAARAENKPVQLVAARELGFALPDTLVSNDPARIRRFVRRHAEGGAVYKAFRPVTWESPGRYASLYTARVDESMLPDDGLLRASPGIYQALVPKACELRVTCIGDEAIAARLDSQATRTGKTDWRLAAVHDLQVEPYALSESLQQRCRALLASLGLVFGCIDFIVTPDGEHVFLEVNQMGQFLWVEEVCPDLPLLDTFCSFLASRDPHYRRPAHAKPRHAFADVLPEARAMLDAESDRHVRPASDLHVVQE
ncbi:MAG: hypothetical protein JSR59_12820 [Proteobacteria bacterium]|nr:hypothetical protein [Pseudomonadota bacterium]